VEALAGEPVRAAEWLGLVLAHPSFDVDAKQRADALLATLRETLSAEELEAALARGKALDLQAVVDELLARSPAPSPVRASSPPCGANGRRGLAGLAEPSTNNGNE